MPDPRSPHHNGYDVTILSRRPLRQRALQVVLQEPHGRAHLERMPIAIDPRPLAARLELEQLVRGRERLGWRHRRAEQQVVPPPSCPGPLGPDNAASRAATVPTPSGPRSAASVSQSDSRARPATTASAAMANASTRACGLATSFFIADAQSYGWYQFGP